MRRFYEIGAIKISRKIKGKSHDLWLVISRNTRHGGLCYLLDKSILQSAIEVAKWASNGYGLRWSIEEYHRHVKQEYKLEDVQNIPWSTINFGNSNGNYVYNLKKTKYVTC